MNADTTTTLRRPAASYSKRMLKTHEVIALSDWLRQDGQLAGLGTFQQVADKAMAQGILATPPSLSSIENIMRTLGVHLDKPAASNDVLLARALVGLCKRLGEADALPPELLALAQK